MRLAPPTNGVGALPAGEGAEFHRRECVPDEGLLARRSGPDLARGRLVDSA